MKNAVLFAFALLVAGAGMAQPSFAAAGNEPAATTSEPMKTKPVKRHLHKHDRHSHNLKAHRTHRA